jgi:cell division protein FtsB
MGLGKRIVSPDDRSLEEKRVSAVESKLSWKSHVAKSLYRVRRRLATGLAVVLAIFLGFHVMFGRNGVNSYEQKRTEDRDLKKQIDALQQENSRLNEHVDRLKNDPDAIEHEARERLHYARPGEVIYTLEKAPAAKENQPVTNAAR